MFLVVDPNIAYFYLRDYVFNISSPSGIFSQGEIIEQVATGAKGMVKYANTSVVGVRRLQFETDWVANTYTNSTWLVLGESSGATANLKSFATDLSSAPIGADAVIAANVVSSPGVVSSLQVMASGFAFNRSINDNGVYEDLVTFTSQDGLRSGTALATLYGQGTSAGYYKDRNGFLSSTKKLTDSNYFTPYSYDIRTPVSPNLYLTMLKKLLHAAGKNYFTSVYRTSLGGKIPTIQSAIVTTNFGFILHIPTAHITASVHGLREYTLNAARATATARQYQPFAYKVGATATVNAPVRWIQIAGQSATATASAHNGALNIGGNIKALVGSASTHATAQKVTTTG